MIATALTLLKTLLKAVTPTTPNSPISSSEALRFLVTTCFALMFIAQPTTVYAQEAPNVSITSSTGNNGNSVEAAKLSYTATFSEGVTGFDVNDITVTGTAGVTSATNFVTVSTTVYTFDVFRGAPDGTVIVSIAKDSAMDSAGNGNTASGGFAFTIRTPLTITSMAQTVNVNSFTLTGTARPGSDLTVSHRVSFSSAPEKTLTTTATNWQIEVTLFEGDNEFQVARNLNKDDTTYSNSVDITLDSTAPAAPVITSPTTPTTPTNDNTLTITGTAEADSTVTLTQNGAALPTTATIDSDSTWSVDVTLQDGANTFTATATDQAGNVSGVSNSVTVKLDQTKPTIQITSTATSPTNTSPIPIQLRFSEELLTEFEVSDITVSGGTITTDSYRVTSSGVFDDGSASPDADFTITPSADGLITVRIAADAAQDSATNGNIAATFDITYDGTAPSVTITSTSGNTDSTVGVTTLSYTATFSEDVTGFELPEITVTGTANGGSPAASNLQGTGASYTFDVVKGSSDGSVIVSIAAGVAMDAAGNNNTASGEFELTIDTTAPIITLTGANPQTIESGADYIELGATTDDGSEVSVDSSAYRNVVGTYIITYTATDGTNQATATRTVNVVDTTAPIITLTGANPQTIESGADYIELGATTDDGSEVSVDSSAYRNVVGTYIITYTATDGTNQATATRTVNVVDTTAPIITLTGANPQTIESGADYIELGATTDDGSEVSVDSSAYRNVVGTYIITYTATDGTNQATATRTVNVVDTTAPIITLTGANPQTIESGADYIELGATTDDGSEVSVDSSAYRNVVGTYIITYTATDGTNQATATRTVNVVDTTAPIITLTGANPQTIESGADYIELGATTDDGSEVSVDSSAYRNVVGTYIITYTATDGTNQATATRTVNVVDTTAPIITLTGANPQTIESGADYIELGATTDDGSEVSVDSSAYRNVVGTYIITYTATDGTNQATATRTVNVVDTTAPIITLTGANPQTIESGADYIELGATTDDGSEVSVDSSAYRNVVGTYIITYTATDGTNQATATRTVNVVDTTAPIITLTGANPQTIESGADYIELGATTDDGSEVSVDSSAYRNVVGTYIITYTATDGTNQATATRTVNVVDTTAPIITLTGANPQTIESGADYIELGATTDDGSEVSVDSSAYRNVVGTYIITYTATDGTNQATATRTVNVVDTTAPDAPAITPPTTPTNDDTITITGTAEAGSTVTLTQNDNVLTSTATATAGGAWTIEVTLSTDNNGANVFTATASDVAGNTSAATDAVNVTLDTAPSFGTATVTNQTYTAGTTISALTLPEATDGNGALTYSLAPSLPQGLAFDAASRTISGTPDAETASTSYTYIAADSDTNTAATDRASLTFSITVLADGLSEEDIQRLNQAIMPRLTQALVASSAAAVERRIDIAFSGSLQAASYQLDGYQIQLNGQTTLGEKLAGGLLQKLLGYGRTYRNGNMDWKQMLSNSSFVLPLGATAKKGSNTGLAVWESGDYSRLSEDDQGIDWEGDLINFQLGVDKRLDKLLLGGMVAWSKGNVDYTLEGDRGTYNHQITSFHPYLAWSNACTNLWGSLGYGQGELTIEQDKNTHSTDTSILSLAAGIKGRLITPGLILKSDILLARTHIDAAADVNIARQIISSQRLRLLLEIAGQYTLASGSTIKPLLEIGARYDGGDGNTGAGAVLGAGMRYTKLTGLTLEGNLHALAGSGNYKEWGIQVLISLDPGADQLGLAFSLQPGYGYNQTHSNANSSALWQQNLSQSSLHNRAADYSAPNYGARLNANLSYGLVAPGTAGLLTPYSEVSVGSSNHYRLGLHWTPNSPFNLHLYGEHRQSSGHLEGSRAVDQAILLEGTVRF